MQTAQHTREGELAIQERNRLMDDVEGYRNDLELAHQGNLTLKAQNAELLEALKHAQAMLMSQDAYRVVGGKAAFDMHVAAIAKAEGK